MIRFLDHLSENIRDAEGHDRIALRIQYIAVIGCFADFGIFAAVRSLVLKFCNRIGRVARLNFAVVDRGAVLVVILDIGISGVAVRDELPCDIEITGCRAGQLLKCSRIQIDVAGSAAGVICKRHRIDDKRPD